MFSWFRNINFLKTDDSPDIFNSEPIYYVPTSRPNWTVTETTYTRPYIYYSPARPGKRWKK